MVGGAQGGGPLRRAVGRLRRQGPAQKAPEASAEGFSARRAAGDQEALLPSQKPRQLLRTTPLTPPPSERRQDGLGARGR
eukprot:9484924-Pyramimonas_sp.AAC.1